MADIRSFSVTHRSHALTLGCTGMLSAAGMGLEDDGFVVSYLSRSGRLPKRSNGTAYTCDWGHEAALRRAAHEAVLRHGVPKLVVAWTHSVSQALSLARCLSSPTSNIRFHHILGSSVRDPARKDALSRIQLSFSDLPGINWHAICLGFMRSNGQSRWLSHEEISEGTLKAIRLETPIYTIGQTAPWKYRP